MKIGYSHGKTFKWEMDDIGSSVLLMGSIINCN